MRCELATAGRVVIGPGVLGEAGPAVRSWGRRALVVTGRRTERAEPLRRILEREGVGVCFYAVAGEPTLEVVREGVAAARREGCEVVVAFGGGSALDAGKAMAGMLTNPGDVLDYLEVIGRGQPLVQAAAPLLAVPTTAGTGAEVTRNAVLTSTEHKVKASLRSPLLLPRLALVDAELTVDLPAELTASTGLDALTQLIEPYVCLRANPITDGFCWEGMGRVARSLGRAYAEGRDREARADMALASVLSGMALANAGLGAVHGLAAPIGGMFAAPHGAVCAALLPGAMRINIRALRERDPGGGALRRYDEVARRLTGRVSARAEEGICWVEELCRDLRIPTLSRYGVKREDISAVVEKAMVASSMKANPVVLTKEEVGEMVALGLG